MQKWPLAEEKDKLVALLNFSGQGQIIWENGDQLLLAPNQCGWLRLTAQKPSLGQRFPGSAHECLELHFPLPWLRQTLRSMEMHLTAPIALLAKNPHPSWLIEPLTSAQKLWARSAMAPHLCSEAQQLLDVTRLTEFLLKALFPAQVPSPEAQTGKRTLLAAQQRLERVKQILRANLEKPPNLAEIAKMVSTSPHHLSRSFKALEGKSLSLWLRTQRIERAAELLRSGQYNISEAALEVGYTSFSHFSRAFKQEKGTLPSHWLRQ
jgi:AraC-like DNA-binding protein